jgi:alpha-L-fucosidase
MRKLLAFACIIISIKLPAQTYQANWESLDNRPVPQWFKDAKFGIFIHWGVYSVPGWSSKGNYAEWYQQGLQTTDTARMKFHKAKFGNRGYYDLANDFKAELFNPDDWAKLFEQSGAKYIVLTSKHHDGFALWPSREASKTWGFAWNAVETGPHRDLLGDLFRAVRKTSVHAGMYYSLYEWFNPLWKSDRDKFVREHTWPQMKDLINTYQPEVFWTDGDWDAPAETWKSQEFLAWLYNESPVKDRVVVNDRWGSGIRFHHAGIYTPEYQPDLDFEDHYWEESRGMGYSYGYNREEDAWDYNSTQSLVLQLIDKVSRGGNFLLDIGPDEHGKIPPIMQERLLGIGDWLKLNGEAIYGTTRCKQSSQWSEGRRDYKDRSGDMLLKITVDPDPGYAVKEVFFTYQPARNNLYAIIPKYPDNRKLRLKKMSLPAGTKITLLANGSALSWSQQGDDVEVSLPEYNPNTMKAPYAYVLRIEGFGRFAPRPWMNVEYKKGELRPLVTLASAPGTRILYSIGDESAPVSTLYTGPFTLDKTATVRAIAEYDPSTSSTSPGLASTVVSEKLQVYTWRKSRAVVGARPGIGYRYFEPSGKIDLSAINGNPVATGVADSISVQVKRRPDRFALEFTGYIRINKDAIYTFYTNSDDGSKLFIDGDEVVNNDGDHGATEKNGRAALKKGYHPIKLVYYDSGGGNELTLSYEAEGGRKSVVPASILFH